MDKWEEDARNRLRAQMSRQNISFKALQARLDALGIHDTPVNLSNKIGRGKFSYSFYLQCLEAMKCEPSSSAAPVEVSSED